MGIPLPVFPATFQKYSNFKTIFYKDIMGYIPFKIIIFQASCRKVMGHPITIVVNLIENHLKVTIFPVSCRKYW